MTSSYDRNKNKMAKKSARAVAHEDSFVMMDRITHVLKRPDTYVGSIEQVSEIANHVTVSEDLLELVPRESDHLTVVHAFIQIFYEVFSNAVDNYVRSEKEGIPMSYIKVQFDMSPFRITIVNDGLGIPVAMSKHEIYVPELIFGTLLTSSNYDDTEDRRTGGRNGLGVKLANIFSTKFTVEIVDAERCLKYTQTWTNNMREVSKYSKRKLTKPPTGSKTSVSFEPDLSRFEMTDNADLLNDMIREMAFRVHVAAATLPIKVTLNNKALKYRTAKSKIYVHINSILNIKASSTEQVIAPPVSVVEEDWEVALGLSTVGFYQLSSVNRIMTKKGGTHVSHVLNPILKELEEQLNSKLKTTVRKAVIKDLLSIFVFMETGNPTFDSQSKEALTLSQTKFSRKFSASAIKNLVSRFLKSKGTLDYFRGHVSDKHLADANKKATDKKKQKTNRLVDIPKLTDANLAGTEKSKSCTLILTEGDSAKSLAEAGISSLKKGRDHYGIFPLRGKPINVRNFPMKRISENGEIMNVVKILGLEFGKKYDTPESRKSLRYGRLMLMSDQDDDGTHIKCLIINIFDKFWPSLLKCDFVSELNTPLVVVRQKGSDKKRLEFFFQADYEAFAESNPAVVKTANVKYYKGLGTSDSREAKDYFQNLDRYVRKITFPDKSSEMVDMAFNKSRSDDRKEFIATKDPKVPFVFEESDVVKVPELIEFPLTVYWYSSIERAIPSVIDGLKSVQRKALYVVDKLGLESSKKEVKVAAVAGQLSNYGYHHGETSAADAIILMAQDFPGSREIPYFQPKGQFGSRLQNGADAASPRYTETKKQPYLNALFPSIDSYVLPTTKVEGKTYEPNYYTPIIPMALINGSIGIATGWSTASHPYGIREVMKYLSMALDKVEAVGYKSVGDPIPDLPKKGLESPVFRDFMGTVVRVSDNKFAMRGVFSVSKNGKEIYVTELPLDISIEKYKTLLSEVIQGIVKKVPRGLENLIDFIEGHTEVSPNFTLVFKKGTEIPEDLTHSDLGLESSLSTSNYVFIGPNNSVKCYGSPYEVFQDFFKVRLDTYVLRKEYVLGELKKRRIVAKNKARFISEVRADRKSTEYLELRVPKEQLVETLRERKYDTDPYSDDNSDEPSFGYLLRMHMSSMTEEAYQKLLEEAEIAKREFKDYKRKSIVEIYRKDIDEFIEVYKTWKPSYRR